MSQYRGAKNVKCDSFPSADFILEISPESPYMLLCDISLPLFFFFLAPFDTQMLKEYPYTDDRTTRREKQKKKSF